MSKKLFERFDGPQVTDSMIQEASQLNLQSLVSQLAVFVACVSKQLLGSRVRLSKERLRRDYLPDGLLCSYVRVTVDGNLAGNAFVCRWTASGKKRCWVTQLVVHQDYRERGLAVGLLNEFRQDDDVYGIMSSLAAAKAFGSKLKTQGVANDTPRITNALATPYSYYLRSVLNTDRSH